MRRMARCTRPSALVVLCLQLAVLLRMPSSTEAWDVNDTVGLRHGGLLTQTSACKALTKINTVNWDIISKCYSLNGDPQGMYSDCVDTTTPPTGFRAVSETLAATFCGESTNVS